MLILVLVFALPIIIFLKVLFDTRGVCFFSGYNSTDNEKVIQVSDEIKLLNWPSKMHLVPWGRAQLREYWVLGLCFIGQFYKKKITDHRNITLALLANLGSSICIYYLASGLTNQYIGIFISLLYMTAVWPYHVAIFMGHVHLAQFFFLLSVFTIQLGVMGQENYNLFYYFLSGVFCAASFVSSSASRKFPPFFLAIYLGLHHNFFYISDWSIQSIISPLRLGVTCALGVIFASGLLLSNQISLKMANFLILKTKKNWNDQRTIEFINEIQGSIAKICRTALIFLILAFLTIKDMKFLSLVSVTLLGIFLVAFHILMPAFLDNLNRYHRFLNIGNWANHFKSYAGREIEIFGHLIPEGFRGAGLRWIPRFFWQVMPFICLLYMFSLGFFTWDKIQNNQYIELLFFIFLSLVPTIVTEYTKGLQVGKSYFPSFVGLLVIITKGLESFQLLADKNGNQLFWVLGLTLLALLLLGQVIHSIYFYITDVLPSRMAPTYLRNFLKMHHIDTFSTYDNAFNNSFVKTMLYTYPNEFTVNYCSTISESKDAYFISPNTSSKSVSMETESYSIENGDFNFDPILSKLIATKRIEQLALAKFKTMGSSKFYVHESEITSYRSLILKQINAEDRFRGIAWVLPIKDLKM